MQIDTSNHLIMGRAGSGKTYFGIKEEIIWNAQHNYNLLVIGRIEDDYNMQVLQALGYTVKKYVYSSRYNIMDIPNINDLLNPKIAIFWTTESIFFDPESHELKTIYQDILSQLSKFDYLPMFTTVIIDDIGFYGTLSTLLQTLPTAQKHNMRFVLTGQTYRYLYESLSTNFYNFMNTFGIHDYFDIEFGWHSSDRVWVRKIFDKNSLQIFNGNAVRKFCHNKTMTK